MRLIIAATDFSPVSLNAVQYAANMATATNSDLALFHVCEVPLPLTEVPMSSDDTQALIDDATEELNKLKDKIEESNKGLNISTEVRLGSSVLEQLEDYSAVTSPFCVIVGANATGAFERFMLGNKAVALARQLEWPLIVVPDGIRFSAIRNVGLASDFEIPASAMIAELKNFVGVFGAKVHVLHVIPGEKSEHERHTEAFTKFTALLEELHPSYHIVNNVGIDNEILRFAERNDLDMMIVVPKPRSIIGSIFHRSHTRQAILHSTIPVMALHE